MSNIVYHSPRILRPTIPRSRVINTHDGSGSSSTLQGRPPRYYKVLRKLHKKRTDYRTQTHRPITVRQLNRTSTSQNRPVQAQPGQRPTASTPTSTRRHNLPNDSTHRRQHLSLTIQTRTRGRSHITEEAGADRKPNQQIQRLYRDIKSSGAVCSSARRA
jgi:hypothetical protein